jgi:hypothetical protein
LVLEASTSEEETTDAVALTCVGEAQLTSDQWGFLTLCGDGDLVERAPRVPGSPAAGSRMTEPRKPARAWPAGSVI